MSPTPALPSPFPSGALRLNDWGLIRAQGEDAAKFLQGQLTNDVLTLRADEARLAGFCSAKGRLLASFIVWRGGVDELLLACSADLLASMLKRLSMFVLRARCKLSDATAELPLYGLAGEAATQALGDQAPAAAWTLSRPAEHTQVLRLPDVLGQARYLQVAPAASPAPALPELPATAWRWLEVASGITRIVAPTTEAFVPQMVNLELVGGVSFKKGCYPGQEVVARSQYRGTLKRRGFLLAGEVALTEGQEVFQAADPGQPAGTVALAAQWPGVGSLALVELKRAAAAAGDLHLGAADGPALHLQSLPYTVPAEEA